MSQLFADHAGLRKYFLALDVRYSFLKHFYYWKTIINEKKKINIRKDIRKFGNFAIFKNV